MVSNLKLHPKHTTLTHQIKECMDTTGGPKGTEVQLGMATYVQLRLKAKKFWADVFGETELIGQSNP